MKILHVVAGGKHGGAETYSTDVICALNTHPIAKQAGIQQKVITRPHSNRLAQMQHAGINPIKVNFCRITGCLTRWKIKREVKNFQPDIVHYWLRRSGQLSIPTPQAVSIGWMGGYHSTKSFKHCDHLIAITPDLKKVYGAECFGANNQYGEERIHIVHTFAPEKAETRYTQEELGIHKTMLGKPTVLCLSRLDHAKGIIPLLDAMVDVDASLIIAGTGPNEEEFKAYANQKGLSNKVVFLGWREDKMELLNSADVLAFPTRKEGFGTVMVEAWSAGTPVVATKAEGPMQFIRHEDNGLLVDIDDAKGLAENINRILHNKPLTEHIIKQAHADYKKHFCKEAVIQKMVETYKNVLAQK